MARSNNERKAGSGRSHKGRGAQTAIAGLLLATPLASGADGDLLHSLLPIFGVDLRSDRGTDFRSQPARHGWGHMDASLHDRRPAPGYGYGYGQTVIDQRVFDDIALDIGDQSLDSLSRELFRNDHRIFPGRGVADVTQTLRGASASFVQIDLHGRRVHAIAIDTHVEARADLRSSWGRSWGSASETLVADVVVRVVAIPKLERGSLGFDIAGIEVLRCDASAYGRAAQRDADAFAQFVGDFLCAEIPLEASRAVEPPLRLRRGQFASIDVVRGDLVLTEGRAGSGYAVIETRPVFPPHRPPSNPPGWDRPRPAPSRPSVITHEVDRPLGAQRLDPRVDRLPLNTVVIFEDEHFGGRYEVIDITGRPNDWNQIGRTLSNRMSSVKWNLAPGVIVTFARYVPDDPRQENDLGQTYTIFGSGADATTHDNEFGDHARVWRYRQTGTRGREGATNTVTLYSGEGFTGRQVTIDVNPSRAGVLRTIPGDLLRRANSLQWNLERGVVVELYAGEFGQDHSYTMIGFGQDSDLRPDKFNSAAQTYAIYRLPVSGREDEGDSQPPGRPGRPGPWRR